MSLIFERNDLHGSPIVLLPSITLVSYQEGMTNEYVLAALARLNRLTLSAMSM